MLRSHHEALDDGGPSNTAHSQWTITGIQGHNDVLGELLSMKIVRWRCLRLMAWSLGQVSLLDLHHNLAKCPKCNVCVSAFLVCLRNDLYSRPSCCSPTQSGLTA